MDRDPQFLFLPHPSAAIIRTFPARLWAVMLWLLVFVAPSYGPFAYAQDEHAHGGVAPGTAPRTIRSLEDLRALRSTHGLKTAVAVRIDGDTAVVVDGQLKEAIWTEAPLASGFLQRDPQEAQAASERTEFRILYDQKTLYLGVTCYDSQPDKILATERQRDGRMQNDDTIAILLDTFHDHRNFFLFQTNPLGTQHDALDTDEGRDHNVGWDTVWQVSAQIIPAVGWTAEFAIPFKSLRLAGTEAQTWGLDMERIIRRKNEFSHWTNFKRDFKRESISQGGHLHGIEDIDPGFRLRVKPFSVAGFTRSSNNFAGTTEHAMDGGMEVLKFRVTPSLMADFIANSNFVETQADRTQVNMDPRFDLFYPEQREFFQEAGVFQFGVERGEMPAPDVALFHTRQIGVFSRRVGAATQQTPVPITAGTRLTGKVQGFNVGLMNVQTGAVASENIPQSNYGVYRIKRDILGRSSVGGFFLDRELAGTGDYNRVYGLDTNFILKEHFFANALYARSLQPGVNQDNWTSSGGARWQTDSMLVGFQYLMLDPNFRDDLGFIPRTNQRRFTPILEFNPRFKRLEKVVRRMHYYSRMDYITDQEYTLQTRRLHFHFDTLLQSGALISVFHHREFERINDPFELRPGVPIPAGGYNMQNFSLGYGLNPARRISGSFRYIAIRGHLGGNVHRVTGGPRIKVLQGLTVSPSYTINKADYPGGSFTDHVVNTGIEYAFNSQWLTSTIIRYNNADSFFGLQFRLNYIFRPGDDFFFVYNLGRATGGVRYGQMDQTIAAKMTYSFDF